MNQLADKGLTCNLETFLQILIISSIYVITRQQACLVVAAHFLQINWTIVG